MWTMASSSTGSPSFVAGRNFHWLKAGMAPGGRLSKFGGLLRTGGVSGAAESDGINAGCEADRLSFGRIPPRPETELPGRGLPPLMLKQTELFPAPPPVPPLLAVFPSEEPFALSGPAGEPPGTPGVLPSGEMETRAARFPRGGCTTGAGGPGVAERAMNVAAAPFDDAGCAARSEEH